MSRKSFLSIGECMIEMAGLPGDDFRLGFAGDTLNTAWYARACLPQDAWSVSYFTRLGADPYSARIRDFLEGNDIETKWISTDPKRQPGLYLISIDNGERSFTYWRSQSAARYLADDQPQLERALAGTDIVYFSAITLAILAPDKRDVFLTAVSSARNAGKLVVFDPNIRQHLWESLDCLKATTMKAAAISSMALPSFDDETAIFGDASLEACADRYRQVGADRVVVKNGGGPMVALDRDRTYHFAGLEKLQPVDTTGAGDSFNGGLLASLAAGHPLDDAIAFAHNISAQVIMHRGALMPMGSLRAW